MRLGEEMIRVYTCHLIGLAHHLLAQVVFAVLSKDSVDPLSGTPTDIHTEHDTAGRICRRFTSRPIHNIASKKLTGGN
jgi:hypothetical protein